ncbi:MAG TPA: type II toxin-antitoxin system HicA family toxin [Longimicrobium sp.]|jgi:hypothetical protein
MKKRHQATVANVLRLNGGTHWDDVEDLLVDGLNAEVYEGSGSTVTFVIGGLKFTVDRPHPRRECGRGLVKRVKKVLGELNVAGD